MDIRFIDSHCHLQFSAYDYDRAAVIDRLQQSGGGAVCVGTDFETSRRAVDLALKYDFIWATVGFHPGHVIPAGFDDPSEGTTAAAREPFDSAELEKLAQHPRVVGIGECGFDFFRISSSEQKEVFSRQAQVFQEQIELSLKLKKPLSIHCRPSPRSQDAYLKGLELLKGVTLQGVFHFFTGSVETVQTILDQGFFIALPGVVTFTKEYDDLISYLPLDRVLIETDSPYAAPVPYRGKRNEPVYVLEVAKKISEIKSLSIEEVFGQTLQNTRHLFRLL